MIVKLVRYAYQKEPAAALAVLNWAAGAVLGLTGHPEFTPILVAVGLAFLGVRAKVVPVGNAQEAATTAAIEVAKNITDGTAGAVGEFTGQAAGVVDEALELVSGLIGKKK